MIVTSFNWFDWILIAIVIFSMVMAFRRGLVRAIFGMLGFVGGFLLAANDYIEMGDWINTSRLVVAPSTARVIGFLLIVVVVAVVFEIAGRFVQKALKVIGLSFLDRILGMAFGFARGCLIGIGLLMIPTTLWPQSDMVVGSALSPYLLTVVSNVSYLVPRALQRVMMQGGFNLQKSTSH